MKDRSFLYELKAYLIHVNVGEKPVIYLKNKPGPVFKSNVVVSYQIVNI